MFALMCSEHQVTSVNYYNRSTFASSAHIYLKRLNFAAFDISADILPICTVVV